MSFSLATSSKNLTEYIAQINRLVTLTDGDCVLDVSVSTGPSITVNEEFLINNKKMPAKLHGKVTVNPKIGFPDPIASKTQEKLDQLLYRDDDPVLLGYAKKYNVRDANTYVIIYDLSCPNIHMNSVSLMISLMKTLNRSSTILFVVTGGDTDSSKSLTNVNLTLSVMPAVRTLVTPELEWGLAVKLASLCDNHILMNTATSTLCAKIGNKSSIKVWCPIPLVDGSNPESGWFGINIPSNFNSLFDNIYYINMDKRTDRRQHMEQQLSKFNLAAARVVGVDGKTLQWHPNLGALSTYWNNGALGYCLSYQNALIDAIKNKYQRVLIMDDDAVLSDNFLEVLEKAFKTLPNDWHLLYLAANHNKESMPTAADRISESLFRLKGSVGSHAVIINRPAFETILNYASNPYGPLDVYLSVYQQICPCFITYPGLATQLPGRSDIINKDVDYNKDWGVDYINHIDYLR